jgi:hypothetical protein
MYSNNNSILIVIPTIDCKIHTDTMMSVMNMEKILLKNDYKIEIIFPVGSLISRIRNEASKYFLDSKNDYLLFIDADLGNFEHAILDLLKSKKDIIGCTYPKKHIDKEMTKYDIDNKYQNHQCNKNVNFNINLKGSIGETLKEIKLNDGVVEVKNLPTGFMLINRNVFNKLIQDNPTIKYKDYSGKLFYDFFKVGIVNSQYLSEDYYFNYLCTESGLKTYCNFNFSLKHHGNIFYQGCFYEYLYKYSKIHLS